MQGVFVSIVEGLHDVDNNVRKMKKLHNTNFTILISSFRMLPTNIFYMYILLCHMMSLHAVGPILKVEVQLLENEFNKGHRDGVSQGITTSIIEGWHLRRCHSMVLLSHSFPLTWFLSY